MNVFRDKSGFFSSKRFCWPSKEMLTKLETAIASVSADQQRQIVEWVQSDDDRIQIRSKSPEISLDTFPCSERRSHSNAEHCRVLNSTLQTQQPAWLKMIEISKSLELLMHEKERLLAELSTDWSHSIEVHGQKILSEPDAERRQWLTKEYIAERTKEQRGYIELKEKDLMDYLRSISKAGKKSPFINGPVGDLPLHDSILLDLHDVAKQIIEEFFNTPYLVSLPYTNDLDPWRKEIKTQGNTPLWEDGLYTGEHIVYMQHKLLCPQANKALHRRNRPSHCYC